MARSQARYACQQCGATYARWTGRCEGCGAWNSLVEELPRDDPPAGIGRRTGRRIGFVGLTGESALPPRQPTGIAEFDRVCGGGLVPGSALLIGGDPGIGKSTLLLQTVTALATAGLDCLYVSGEESLDQVRLRAARLGVSAATVQLAAATSVRDIAATLDHAGGPTVVVIDSIQTAY